MTATHSHRSQHRLDGASLALLLVGVLFGAVGFWLVASRGFNALILIPSIAAVITGALHITKREAPRS